MTRSSHIAAQFAPTLATETTSFALVGHGPPVPAVEVERSERDSLEVRVMWDSNVLATHFLERRGSIVIGDHEESIALIPSESLGSDSFEVATATEGGYVIRVPSGAEALVKNDAAWRRIEDPLRSRPRAATTSRCRSVPSASSSPTGLPVGRCRLRRSAKESNAAQRFKSPALRSCTPRSSEFSLTTRRLSLATTAPPGTTIRS